MIKQKQYYSGTQARQTIRKKQMWDYFTHYDMLHWSLVDIRICPVFLLWKLKTFEPCSNISLRVDGWRRISPSECLNSRWKCPTACRGDLVFCCFRQTQNRFHPNRKRKIRILLFWHWRDKWMHNLHLLPEVGIPSQVQTMWLSFPNPTLCLYPLQSSTFLTMFPIIQAFLSQCDIYPSTRSVMDDRLILLFGRPLYLTRCD